MVKLTDKEIRWIVRHVENNDAKTKQAASIDGVSMRRVQQLVKEYREADRIPQLTKRRRPRTYLTEEQKETIDRVWNETRVGARLLYYELKRIHMQSYGLMMPPDISWQEMNLIMQQLTIQLRH